MQKAIDEIINIAGRGNSVDSPAELRGFSVCGIAPRIAVAPKTVEELSRILQIAHRDGIGVIPFGGGTKIHFGKIPKKYDIALSTRNLTQVLEHESSDLVATAECGISLKNLQSSLRAERQFLAIDPRHTGQGATLGGIIAANDFGARRHKYGTMRELLIGVKVVRADGSIFRGGAKVVKNVAGYDLPKLFVGSFGTLGVLAEATFRLYPVPEASRTWLAGFASIEALYKSAQAILNSSLTPASLQMLSPDLIGGISDDLNLNLSERKFALAVRVESVPEAARSEILKAAKLSGGDGCALEGDTEERFWDGVREFPSKIPGNTVIKIGAAISDVPQIFNTLDELSRRSGVQIMASAGAGSGAFIVSAGGEESAVVESIKTLRDFAESLGGSLVIQEASNGIKSQIDVWGDAGGGALNVMRRLKSLFDGKGILNSGRFVGDI